MIPNQEPLVHGVAEDGLPDGHPLQHEDVDCAVCGELLHSSHDEAMQPWVETGLGGMCIPCFARSVNRYDLSLPLRPEAHRVEFLGYLKEQK